VRPTSLRFQWHPRLLAALLLLIAGMLSVLFVQLPGNTLLWRALQNAAHLPLFGVVALAALYLLRGLFPIFRARLLAGYLAAGAASLMLGILSELGQLMTHRDPSVIDLARDLVGIASGLGIYSVFDPLMRPTWQGRGRAFRAWLLALCSILLALGLFSLARTAVAYLQRDLDFPVVIDPRASWSRPFMQCKHARLVVEPAPGSWALTSSQPVARLDLDAVRYSGLYMEEPHPDWRSFRHLTFTIYSPQRQPLNLTLRIEDALHDQAYSDRFNRSLEIAPGENTFRIPLAAVEDAPAKRSMDMSRIRAVALFSVDLNHPADIFLGKFRLE
jgi:hypothetical protein